MQRYRAERPGQLPTIASVGNVELPPGKLIVPDPSYARSSPHTDPVLWVSDEREEPVGILWSQLAEHFEQTGLWPLVLDSLDADRADDRPWLVGELEPGRSRSASTYDAATVLAESWRDCLPSE